jgi:N6-L-threonylcarbamoyladenine synthase
LALGARPSYSERMLILGIETSCDDTAVGLVVDGRQVLSSVVGSQVELHARYGGIVPEVASRQHILSLLPITQRALDDAGASLNDVDAVAVTYGPGLAGSLLVGVNFAKGQALGRGLPLIGVNHLEAHVYAGWLLGFDPSEGPGFPLMCLIASGGHTDLVLMEGHGQYRLLGRTRDDAAGEAFDKVARVLGMGFPGGPLVQKAAEAAVGKEKLTRPWLRGSNDFSFSGLKTAVLHLAQAKGLYPPEEGVEPDPQQVAEVAAAFQASLVDVLVGKTVDLARQHEVQGILLGGGVAANGPLRRQMEEASPVPVIIPPVSLCTDNGAMIAACAYYREQSGLDLDVLPSLRLG